MVEGYKSKGYSGYVVFNYGDLTNFQPHESTEHKVITDAFSLCLRQASRLVDEENMWRVQWSVIPPSRRNDLHAQRGYVCWKLRDKEKEDIE